MNKKRFYGLLVGLIFVFPATATANGADRKTGQDHGSKFMRIYGQALPPIGHVGFCRRHPGECADRAKSSRRMTLTRRRRTDMLEVNQIVNSMVRPVTDQQLYGRIEHWTYPAGRGDCEDYVLLKLRLLMERGWPRSALLITVVRDENNEGHAVLTSRTAQGDYVLDNKRSEIMSWNKTPYSFVKRQSFRDPRAWVSLSPPSSGQTARVAGTRRR